MNETTERGVKTTHTPTNKISVRQPNAITNARYSYTSVEKRVIYHVIMAIQSKIGVEAPDLFSQHLKVNIPYAKLKQWDMNDNLSRDLKTAVRSLRKKDYDIKGEDGGWIDTGFIVFAEYSERKGLSVEVSKALIPALIEVTRGFTAYNAVIALSLQSKYSQRFYEWCCQWRNTGWFEFTPDSLNTILLTDYATGQLRNRVIDAAQKELETMFLADPPQSDVYFTVEEERGGRGKGGGMKKWRFHIKSRDQKEAVADAKSDDFAYIMQVLKSAWPSKPELVNRAADQILTSKSVKIVADRLEKIKTATIANPGGYVRKLLKDEFGIEV